MTTGRVDCHNRSGSYCCFGRSSASLSSHAYSRFHRRPRPGGLSGLTRPLRYQHYHYR